MRHNRPRSPLSIACTNVLIEIDKQLTENDPLWTELSGHM